MDKNWPDELSKPSPDEVEALLTTFWNRLHVLPALIAGHEHLLAAECVAELRGSVLQMMLALNGITRPEGTTHLNTYLSSSQRQALYRIIVTPNISQKTWIGQAVAMVVIYRWYAYQLVAKYYCQYPVREERETLQHLSESLPNWPRQIKTD